MIFLILDIATLFQNIWRGWFFRTTKKYPIKFNIVRFHNIYGPRMGFDHVIPELF